MALEHRRSIVLLTAHSLFGSAAALVRLEFESYVRGIWLLFCASDPQLENFKKDKLERTFGQLIEDLERLDAYNAGTLSNVKKVSWNVMNSFTHSGFYQVARRNTADEIIPNYTDEELLDALSSADSFGILTAIEIANMAKNEALTREIFARGQEYFKNAP
ncbi:MAG: hypothetical protein HYR49_11275 [Gammaproteobacteria bacterium]|nr:hypothetical protein [Gammaproteobacteria bacterium]